MHGEIRMFDKKTSEYAAINMPIPMGDGYTFLLSVGHRISALSYLAGDAETMSDFELFTSIERRYPGGWVAFQKEKCI